MSQDGGESRDRQLDAKGLQGILELMPTWMDPDEQEQFVTRMDLIESVTRAFEVDVYATHGVHPPLGAEPCPKFLRGHHYCRAREARTRHHRDDR